MVFLPFWSGTSMILDSKCTPSSDMQLLQMPQKARVGEPVYAGREHIGQTLGFNQNGPLSKQSGVWYEKSRMP